MSDSDELSGKQSYLGGGVAVFAFGSLEDQVLALNLEALGVLYLPVQLASVLPDQLVAFPQLSK